jgi:hypothetical protein
MRNKILFLIPALAILGILLFAVPALAIGVGTSPATFDISLNRGGSETTILSVVNTEDKEADIKVYIDDENYKGWFSFDPADFTLPPSGDKDVKVRISPPVTVAGDHETRILVISTPPGGGLAIGAGIKIPTFLHISGMLAWPWITGIAVIVIVIIAVAIIFWRRKQNVFK